MLEAPREARSVGTLWFTVRSIALLGVLATGQVRPVLLKRQEPAGEPGRQPPTRLDVGRSGLAKKDVLQIRDVDRVLNVRRRATEDAFEDREVASFRFSITVLNRPACCLPIHLQR